jgi:hypothetical protein
MALSVMELLKELKAETAGGIEALPVERVKQILRKYGR